MSKSISQFYVKRDSRFLFTEEPIPRLLYVARVQPSDQTHPRVLHAHQDLMEVVLICGGRGKFRIGDAVHDVQSGDLLVYDSGVVHDEVSSQEDAVDSYCAGVGGLRMPGLRENALLPEGVPPVFHMGEEAEDLRQLCDLMYRCLQEDRPGCEAVCQHLLLAVLCRVVQCTQDAPPQPVEDAESLGRKIQEYIDRHYTEALTLQDIGDALHISAYYLSHVFKESSGYSPMQYLLRRRIGEAQNLLLNTDLPIARIAEQVGFETQNYFNAQFSKFVGTPPRKYRQDFLEKQLKTTD